MFTAYNGVKQGGILSPLLFGSYMDELLAKLRSSGAGCHMGPYFCGALSYADDICLLSPSIEGLRQLNNVCEEFAVEYNVNFNGDKSQPIKFNPKKSTTEINSNYVYVKGCKVTCTDSVMHLGHTLYSDPNQDDLQSVVNNFNRQYNAFRAKFQCVPPQVRNSLFISYCTSLYGIQLCSLQKSHKLHVTYRKALRNMWGLPYRTHCALLPCITDSLCSEHMCAKRFLNFAKSVLHHDSSVVKYIFTCALKCRNSTFNNNITHCSRICNIQVDTLTEETGLNAHHAAQQACQDNCFNYVDIATASAIKDCMLVASGQFTSVFSISEALSLSYYLCVN